MTQLLNTNDRELLMKVVKLVHLGVKECSSLPVDRNIWLSNSYGGDFLCLFIYFWTFIGYVMISTAVVESERHLY